MRRGDTWRLVPGALTVDAALADLDFFFKTVESVHPRPLANIEEDQYLKLKRESRERVVEATRKDKEQTLTALAVTLARAAAALGDGHTFVRLDGSLVDDADTAPVMLPFYLGVETGRIVILNPGEGLESLQGRRLLKINDIDTLTALAPALELLSGERTAFKLNRFCLSQRTYWALARPIAGPRAVLTVETDDGRTMTQTVDLMPTGDFDRRIHGPQRNERSSSHSFQHDGRTCYWPYNSCDNSDQARARIVDLFKDLQARKAENLIIDLRNNGGGDSDACQFIIDRLTAKPYRLFSRIDLKNSPELLAMNGDHSIFAKLMTGRTTTARCSERRPPKECGERFTGRVFFLIGPGTYSAASDFAAAVKDYGIGVLLGEETGGLRQCFGDILTFHAPNSGLSFGVFP